MSNPCKHETTRFLACSAADRLPGIWECTLCKETFKFDPNKPNGVKYVETPTDPRFNRYQLPPLSTGGKY